MKKQIISFLSCFCNAFRSAPVVLQILVSAVLIVFVYCFLTCRQSRYHFLRSRSSYIPAGAVFDQQRGRLYYFDGDDFQIIDYPRGTVTIKPTVRDMIDYPICTDTDDAPSDDVPSKSDRETLVRENVHNEILALVKDENEKYEMDEATTTAVDEPFGGAKTESEKRKWAERENALSEIGKGKKSYTTEELIALLKSEIEQEERELAAAEALEDAEDSGEKKSE